MKKILVLLIAQILVPHVAIAQVFEGTARAVDGDTLDMTGLRIHLLHIDAPEAAQDCTINGETWHCGADASATLASLVNEQTISCVSDSRDLHGRHLAICRTREMTLGERMAALGLAVVDIEAPEEFRVAGDRAKASRLGLWNSELQMPRDWRAANLPDREPLAAPRTMAPAKATQSRTYRDGSGCTIKGNLSRRGEWIYHLPGQQYYDATRPEELFCSEADARLAGYRRSKV